VVGFSSEPPSCLPVVALRRCRATGPSPVFTAIAATLTQDGFCQKYWPQAFKELIGRLPARASSHRNHQPYPVCLRGFKRGAYRLCASTRNYPFLVNSEKTGCGFSLAQAATTPACRVVSTPKTWPQPWFRYNPFYRFLEEAAR
jgi:hypothetical protein